jgi:ABC-type nickel/cobalt efflux system permease component RcnA
LTYIAVKGLWPSAFIYEAKMMAAKDRHHLQHEQQQHGHGKEKALHPHAHGHGHGHGLAHGHGHEDGAYGSVSFTWFITGCVVIFFSIALFSYA